MKNIYWAFLAGLLFAGTAMPNDAPASDESIHELLVITDAHKMIDSVKTQVETALKATEVQALHGNKVTPQQQAVMDRMRIKVLAILDEVLAWDGFQSMCVRVYRASFTQDEIDGIIVLYKTPAGQAMIKKMPVVMQNIMGEMQGILGPMREKIQKAQQEALEELRNLPQKQADTTSS